MTIENCSVTGNSANENAQLKETISAQAAVILKLREAIKAVEIDSEEVLDFDEFTAMMVPMDTYHALIEALPIPDDSDQVLKEWFDSVMGEPVAWREFDGEGGYYFHYYQDNETFRDDYIKRNPNPIYKDWVEPLFRKPEVK